VDLSTLVNSAPSAVIAIVGLWLFFNGKIHSDSEFSALRAENTALRAENDKLREAIMTERQTVNETVQAGTVTNQLIRALTDIAGERRHPRGLSAEDVGL
jgi:hypothetical protein